jgi:hypothetical protein
MLVCFVPGSSETPEIANKRVSLIMIHHPLLGMMKPVKMATIIPVASATTTSSIC